jgi:hypothetical protein
MKVRVCGMGLKGRGGVIDGDGDGLPMLKTEECLDVDSALAIPSGYGKWSIGDLVRGGTTQIGLDSGIGAGAGGGGASYWVRA